MNETEQKIENKEAVESSLKLSQNFKTAETSNFQNLESKIENFAKDTLKYAEARSKSLNSFISKMTLNTTTGNSIEEQIEDLKNELTKLDPSNVSFDGKKGLLGLFSPVNRYFNSLIKSESTIDAIVNELSRSQEILKNDNITLDIEKNKISETIKRLEQEYDEGSKYKEELSNKSSKSFDEILSTLEKKLFDLKEVMIVNTQSLLAMDIIKKNNKELIRNIDRIKTVTITSLNTASLVAKTVFNQKVVLKKIESLNKSTKSIINSTGSFISNNSSDIASEISKAEISVEGLKQAFNNAFKAIDEVEISSKENIPKVEKEILEIKIDNKDGDM